MANSLYPLGRQKWLEGDVAWLTDDIKVALLSATYVYADTDEFLDDLSGVLATSANLSGKTSTLGVADATDVVFASVAVGPAATQIVVYKDTGVAATSPLLVFYDTNSSSVLLNVAPNGTDITAIWSNGPLKMFRL
jgi:hypothetical protein